MAAENRLFDDLARVATGAMGTLTGMRAEIETRIREQMENLLGRMNLVRREEFDAVQAMAAKARLAQEALEARVSGLECRLAGLTEKPPVPRRPVRLQPSTPRRRPQKPL
jgi:BMFP domain-containing protein YqiC